MFIQLNEQGNPEQWPLTDTAVIALHRATSFAMPLSMEGYPELGICPLDEGIMPSTTRYQRVEEVSPKLVGERWTRQWAVIEFSQEERQAVDAAASQTLREERNKRLSYCDWTQLSDAPVDAAPWAVYRQALRDISDQAGFPWDITWPKEPA